MAEKTRKPTGTQGSEGPQGCQCGAIRPGTCLAWWDPRSEKCRPYTKLKLRTHHVTGPTVLTETARPNINPGTILEHPIKWSLCDSDMFSIYTQWHTKWSYFRPHQGILYCSDTHRVQPLSLVTDIINYSARSKI